MTRAMDMRGDPRSVVRQRFSAGMSLGALCLALSMAAPAEAARQGHGRIVSAPGKPLEVAILEVDLTDADVAALKASVAPAANWAQFGLTPPVAVETLRVAIAPGNSPSSRTLVVTSAQPVDQPVVDILLEHGADPKMKDKDNDTAANFARNRGFTDLAQKLQALIDKP